jgi:NTP pyrophosphatase (non-canonical NTP hydrolase)
VASGKTLRKKAIDAYARSKRNREKFYKKTVDELINEFIAIYGGGHEGVDLWQIAAHLLEEIGEVAEEVIFLSELRSLNDLMSGSAPPVKFRTVVEKAYKKEGSIRGLKVALAKLKTGGEETIFRSLREDSIHTLKEELADVFSWLSAMLFKIGEIMREVRGENKFYCFHDWLAEKNFKDGSFVCFACAAGPCENDCRAVWHVRKVIRDKKRELASPLD